MEFENFEGKCKKKKIDWKSIKKEKIKENKQKVKLDVLFSFVTSNSFYLFNLLV